MDLVKQITDALTSQLSLALDSEYQELCYIYSVEKNTFDGNEKRYGARPLDASAGDTVTRALTLDQTFQVIVTDNYLNVDETDENQRKIVFELHNQLDEFAVAIHQRKIGIPNIVMLVRVDSYEEPEIIEDDKVVVLRANFLVKYRRNLG